MSNVAIWIIVLFLGIVGAILALRLPKVTSENFGNFGQGLAGVVTTIAIVLGGALFIAEGQTQPRLLLQVTATVVGTTASPGPQRAVYVQVVTTIENQGRLSPATIDCAAFDAFGIAPTRMRDAVHPNDLALQPLVQGANQHGRDWNRCLHREMDSSVDGHARPRSGFRWPSFEVRPGQIKTRNYELQVPCTLSGIRIIVKIPDPAGGVLERKVAVSIVDVCRGETARDVTTVADNDSSLPPAPNINTQAPASQPIETSNQGNTQ